jgi:CRP-like cAMP-binding protein
MSDASLESFFRKLEQRDTLRADERQALIDAAGEERTYSAGTDIVREGDRPNRSTLVIEGFSVRYRVLSDGQRQITSIHIPGDFVDLHSFVLKEMDHSVGALSHCRVITFPHANLTRITERFPHLTRVLWLMTLLDASIHREWIVGMGRRSAAEQMSHLICELYTRLNVTGQTQDGSFYLPITQPELGDALGLSAVHVNRVLQELRSESLFTWQGQTVRILDWPRLQQRADFDPRYLHLTSEPR